MFDPRHCSTTLRRERRERRERRAFTDDRRTFARRMLARCGAWRRSSVKMGHKSAPHRRAPLRVHADSARMRDAAAKKKASDEEAIMSRFARDGDTLSDGWRARKGEAKRRRLRRVAAESKKTKGFFELGAIDAYETLDAVQCDTFGLAMTPTSMVEIGVYHGRSFLPLCALRNAGETLVAIDCFDQQEFNVDESGVGNYNKFVSNICRVCGAIKEEDEEFWDGARDASGELPSWLRVIKGNSLVMSAMEIIQAASENDCNDYLRSVRMFSIDGSHTAEATMSDLKLAQACLHARGCVILDDVFNTDWPGCISGLAAYLADPTSTLAPVAIAYNKVILCAKDDEFIRSTYFAALAPRARKTAELFGHTVRIHKHGWNATFYANDDSFI